MKDLVKFLKVKVILHIMSMFFLLTCSQLIAQSGGGEAYPDLQSNSKALNDFSDLKFGMFIHWGPVSLRGTEIGWSRGKIIPIDEYDNLYKEFNPVLFDADSWVKTAKEAGMKYIVFTSKHHDGFCMWPSEFTDYDIASTPYKKDILKELAEACKKYNIQLGFYYSIADWHHPHYGTRYGGDPRPVEDSDMNIYVEYMKNQLRELIERYDPFLIWFDGEWEPAWTHEMGMDLYAYMRGLKDDLLINNRVDKGRKGMEGTTKGGEFAGDFATPEQRIGTYNFEDPWETCMTICKQWAWKPNDKMKTLDESLNTLIRTVGGGGNLLYNVGPMPDGRFELRQTNLLKQMGEWIKKHEKAIYGTRGGPYVPTENYVSTRKGRSIFIFVLRNDNNELVLPHSEAYDIEEVTLMRSGAKLTHILMDNEWHINLPDNTEIPGVIEIKTNRNTEALLPIQN